MTTTDDKRWWMVLLSRLDLGGRSNSIYAFAFIGLVLFALPSFAEIAARILSDPVGATDIKDLAAQEHRGVWTPPRPMSTYGEALGLVIIAASFLSGLWLALVRAPKHKDHQKEILLLEATQEVRVLLSRAIKRNRNSAFNREDILGPLECVSDIFLDNMGKPKAKTWIKLAMWKVDEKKFSVDFFTQNTPQCERDYRVALGEGGIGRYAQELQISMGSGKWKSPPHRGVDMDELKRILPDHYRHQFEDCLFSSEILFPIFSVSRTSTAAFDVRAFTQHGSDRMIVRLLGIGCLCTDYAQHSDWFNPDTYSLSIRKLAGMVSRVIEHHTEFQYTPIDIPRDVWQDRVKGTL